ncbi:Os01g0872300 [Oryza sativa Japonica Group]|uniref:Os01g0872300 protein n=1 Tax=Oryza sativa subsp. japonica TaxID=39947 RepID=C7IW73_ORYSJ|nr:Os01g0872300 [Oryza sativa Japonica Group]|eukprot:NP_001172669.1 Os01g0872300 [Oryza sativa Japonica Group]
MGHSRRRRPQRPEAETAGRRGEAADPAPLRPDLAGTAARQRDGEGAAARGLEGSAAERLRRWFRWRHRGGRRGVGTVAAAETGRRRGRRCRRIWPEQLAAAMAAGRRRDAPRLPQPVASAAPCSLASAAGDEEAQWAGG